MNDKAIPRPALGTLVPAIAKILRNKIGYPGTVTDIPVEGYYKLTRFVTLAGLGFFFISRITIALIGHNRAVITTLVVFCVLALILIFWGRRFYRRLCQAFVEPLLLYLMFIAAALMMKDFSYFFTSSFGLCCIAASYLNSKKMLQFLVCFHLIALVLIFSHLSIKGLYEDMPFSELMVKWVILFFCSSLLYLVTRFAAEKLRTSVRAEEYMGAMLSTSPNGIVLLDQEDRVVYISDTFARFAGLKNPGDALGRPILELFKDDSVRNIYAGLLRKKNNNKVVRKIVLNGKPRYFRIINKNLAGKYMGRYINFVDITPEITEKHKAEAASKSKTAFLAAISHEIRTPLNAIIGLSEIELQKQLPQDTCDDLEEIYQSGSSLLSIINDILDISKIETGNFELIPVIYEVPNLVDDVVHLNIVRVGSKNIVFHLVVDETIPEKLFGDELRVKQIINNLLSNAFKYTREGTVQMEITWEKEDDSAWLIITVSDTGRGIREEDMDKIFIKYCKFDTRANRKIEGTGLGLPIAKQLAEMMGGVISAKSVYGKGTVFRAALRQELPPEQKPIGRETAENLMAFRFVKTRRRRSMNLVRTHMPYGRVLVVDDVSTNLEVMRGLLLPYGLRIDCASGGREAVEKVRRAGEGPPADRYDLVFMDHMMPEIDGVEAVRIIRREISSEYAGTVPIIALTANALNGNKAMFLANGFNGYISKPIDLIQLDAALNTWIRNKQSDAVRRKAETEPSGESAKNELPGGWRIEGVDLKRGQDYYCGGDNYLRVLRSFLAHTPAALDKLRNPAGGVPGGAEDYTVTVHGLKGSCYGICADEAGALAQALENAARAGDGAFLQKKTPVFTSLIEKLLEAISSLLEKLEEPDRTEKPRAAAPDRILLDTLLEACTHYRITQIEEIILKLESREYERGGDLVRELRKQMENLDYEAMIEGLEKQKLKISEEQTC
jgi:PAS domain S-box-containing protein